MKARIERGRYGNDSECCRDLIRRDQDREAKLEALRAAIREGRDSGETEDRVGDIVAEARARKPGLARGQVTDVFFEPLPPAELDDWER